MTITPALMTSKASVGAGAALATDSWTPRADVEYVVAVACSKSGGASAAPSGLAGNGITWTLEEDQPYHTSTVPVRRMSVYKGKNAAPTVGALTATYAASQDTIMILVIEADGVDATTPIPRSVATFIDTAGLEIDVTMDPFDSASNGLLSFVCKNTSTTLSLEAGYSLIGTVAQAVPNYMLHAVWLPSEDVLAQFIWTGTARAAAVGMELKAATTLTAAQKATFLPEVERLIARCRGTLGRLLAHRLAGASISTDLAIVRASLLSLEGKYHDLLTDSIDIDTISTLVDSDLDKLLTAIGDVGDGAPEPVALVKGLMTREFSVAAAPVEAWNPGGNTVYPL